MVVVCSLIVGVAPAAWAGLFDVETKLTAGDAAAGDFGFSASISAGTAIVGAQRDDDAGDMSGSAYVFTPEPSGFVLAALGFLSLAAYVRRRRAT